MVARVFTSGGGFGHAIEYVSQEQKQAEVLAAEGVRAYDQKLMIQDFERQRQFHHWQEKPVFHGILSFPPGEDPGNQRMTEIAQRFLEELKITNTQYLIVKHSDKEHLHMHVVANRVNNEGEMLGKRQMYFGGMQVAEKLTREFGVKQHAGKDLSRLDEGSLKHPDAKRYRLHQAIQEHLPLSKDLDELVDRLGQEGITHRFRLNPDTGEREGISFRIDNHAFKASDVAPGFSMKALERSIAQYEAERQELAKEQRLAEEARLRQEQALKLSQRPDQKVILEDDDDRLVRRQGYSHRL